MPADKNNSEPEKLTILLPGGALPAEVLAKVNELRAAVSFDLYLTTAQNLRLYNIRAADLENIKGALLPLGVRFKGPGLFPLPRICIGQRSCNLGQIDTMAFSARILARFGAMTGVKPKFKIAIAGCPAACSNPILTDIGIIATRQGFDLYLGGKGGPQPRLAKRVMRQADEEQVLKFIEEVVAYHNNCPAKKQRFTKLLEDPQFPYRDEV